MKTLKIWGGGGVCECRKYEGGGIVCSIVWGVGGKLCLSWGGGVRISINFIGGGGVILPLCDMCGGGGIVCTILYKMWEGGRYDVHNVGGERGRFCFSCGGGVFLPQNL